MVTRYIDRIVSNHIKVKTLETDRGEFIPCLVQGDAPLDVPMPYNIMSAGTSATTGTDNALMFSISLTDGDRRLISAMVTIVGDITSTVEPYISYGIVRNVRVWWNGEQYEHVTMNTSSMVDDDVDLDVAIQISNDVMDVLVDVTSPEQVERSISMRVDIVPNVK